MHISQLMDTEKLQNHIRNRYVSVRAHRSDNLVIYNYTHSCALNQVWDKVTIQTRGLITTLQGDVVARPFPKFFNTDQIEGLRNHIHHLFGIKFRDLSKQEFVAYDKLDGSLGILYVEKNFGAVWTYQIATRGSFESPQAIKGSEIFHKQYEMFVDRNSETYFDTERYTYLFEIIYPQNRIVVDYGDKEEVRLLAVIDNETGKDSWVEFTRVSEFQQTIPVKNRGVFHDIKDLPDEQNAEGYVLVYQNGFRLKYKHEEYKRLHKLICGLTEKRIWDVLRNGDDLDNYAKDLPDEFHKWIYEVADKLKSKFDDILEKAKVLCKKGEELHTVNGILNRKEFAAYAGQFECRNLIFMILDGRNYNDFIWKNLEPQGAIGMPQRETDDE